MTFSILEEDSFLTAPASFITSDYNFYILAFLSSNFGKYFIYNNSDTTGAGDIMLNIQSLEKIPIPKPNNNTFKIINDLAQSIIDKKSNNESIIVIEQKLNQIIYNIFEFDNNEINFIEIQ